jgi:glycosyltransferase involved in cell wall biosynthesis
MKYQIEKVRPVNKKIAYLPNHVDTEYFYPDPTVSKNIDLLFIGRFAKEKGIDILFDALSMLGTRYRLVLLGHGPLYDFMQLKSRKLNLNTEFLGHVPPFKIRRFLSSSRYLILPSWAEPQGLVILEALASGTPVIGSNSGAIPEMIVSGHNGWLFEPGDPSSLAQTISNAMQSLALEKMARNARESVLEWDLAYFGEKLKNTLSSNAVHINDTTYVDD